MRKKEKFSNTNPLFFLFTCVKDGRTYINKLFDSLLSQTKVNFVHYIYEDGSSDPIEDLVATYKEKVSKLKYPYRVIYEKNSINIGLNMATKHCIDMCEYPYFIWIDCDNWVDKNFFYEMEKIYLKNPKCPILRSSLYDGVTQKEQSFSSTDLKNIYNKYQMGILLRRKYYYSFFAVNNELYRKINANNTMLNERYFYNDEQILFICYLAFNKSAINKRARGYFLSRDDAESSNSAAHDIDFKSLYFLLANNLKNEWFCKKLESLYFIYENLSLIQNSYKLNVKKSLNLLKSIKEVSKTSGISFKNFYKGNYLFWYFKLTIYSIITGDVKK